MLTTLRINNASCMHSLEIHAGKIGLLCLIVTAVWLSLCYCLFNGPGGFFSPDQLSTGALITAQVITGCLFLSSVIDSIYYLYLFKQRSIPSSPPLPSLASSSQTSSSQTSTSTSPISQTSHSIPVLDFTNKPIAMIVGDGASRLQNYDIIRSGGYNYPISEFLLSSKNPHHLFNRLGQADSWQAATQDQPIQNFPYIISRHFPVNSYMNESVKPKKFVTDVASCFFQGMRMIQERRISSAEKTLLPGTIIFPILAGKGVGHAYVIFVERDESGIFHISLIDSLGATPTSNGYYQLDVREGIEEALRTHFGKDVQVHFHYGPDQNNLMLCTIHKDLNIEAAKRWILATGKKVFEGIPTIFTKRSREELLEHHYRDKEIARQFCFKYESRKAEWEQELLFINDIYPSLLNLRLS